MSGPICHLSPPAGGEPGPVPQWGFPYRTTRRRENRLQALLRGLLLKLKTIIPDGVFNGVFVVPLENLSNRPWEQTGAAAPGTWSRARGEVKSMRELGTLSKKKWARDPTHTRNWKCSPRSVPRGSAVPHCPRGGHALALGTGHMWLQSIHSFLGRTSVPFETRFILKTLSKNIKHWYWCCSINICRTETGPPRDHRLWVPVRNVPSDM